jgi:hypothetical protein
VHIFNWVCPHCNHAQAVVSQKHYVTHLHIGIDGLAEGSVGATHRATGCSNPDCNKLTLHISIGPDERSASGGHKLRFGAPRFFYEQVLPRSSAKPQPEFIPQALRNDYVEACLIRDLSPKAASTLARRCLQGMIRDFGGVTGRTLYEEISELRTSVENGTAPRAVTAESVEAIDHVRSIGNIGAHMEKDIDLIVDVDPNEAQALIELLEMLFNDWYVDSERRRQRLVAISKIGTEKRAARRTGRAKTVEPVDPGEPAPNSDSS